MSPTIQKDPSYLLFKFARSSKSQNIRNFFIFSFGIKPVSRKYGKSSERDHDIAVIIVEKSFDLSKYVTPVCLPTSKRFKIMSGKAIVSGSESNKPGT